MYWLPNIDNVECYSYWQWHCSDDAVHYKSDETANVCSLDMQLSRL